jgi:hypothetical protein
VLVGKVGNSRQEASLPTESLENEVVTPVGNKNLKMEVRTYFFGGCRRLKYPSSPRKYLVKLYENLLEILLKLLPIRTSDNSIVNDYPDLPNVIYEDECRDIFLGLIHANTLMNRTHRVMEGHRFISTYEDVNAVLQLMFPLIELCKLSMEDSWDGYILGIMKSMETKHFTSRILWMETGIDRKKIQRTLHRLHLSEHLKREGNRYSGYIYTLL